MKASGPYADFIQALPQADLPLAGASANLLSGAQAQMVFFELPAGASVPPHSHGAQWGLVVQGRVEMTMAGETRVYAPGECYFIGDGVEHSARVLEDCWAIDVFADPARYRAK